MYTSIDVSQLFSNPNPIANPNPKPNLIGLKHWLLALFSDIVGVNMTSFVEGGFFTSSGNPSPPSKSLTSCGFGDGKMAYYNRDEKSPSYKQTGTV